MQIVHRAASELGVDYAAKHAPNVGTDNINFNNGLPQFPLGYRSRSREGGEFVYVEFDAAFKDGDLVLVDSDGHAKALSTVSAGTETGTLVGVVVSTQDTADGEWGWVQVFGRQSIWTIASVAKNAALNTTATAGQLTGTSATGAKAIDNIVLQAAAASSGSRILTEATLNHPQVGATLS